MYAVITSGGKQYKVGIGETIKLEKIDLAPGQPVTFDQVLLVTDGEQAQIGSPYLQDAKVNAEIMTQGRHDKIRIIKFRRRKHHMKQAGHRQYFTEVKVTGIQVGGQLFETAVDQEARNKRAKESVQAA